MVLSGMGLVILIKVVIAEKLLLIDAVNISLLFAIRYSTLLSSIRLSFCWAMCVG